MSSDLVKLTFRIANSSQLGGNCVFSFSRFFCEAEFKVSRMALHPIDISHTFSYRKTVKQNAYRPTFNRKSDQSIMYAHDFL